MLLCRRLAGADLGQLRVTMVLGGTGALVEVADLEAVPVSRVGGWVGG